MLEVVTASLCKEYTGLFPLRVIFLYERNVFSQYNTKLSSWVTCRYVMLQLIEEGNYVTSNLTFVIRSGETKYGIFQKENVDSCEET